ncbi:MAG: PKD domain-containing protein [Armatimonadota bacterium]
MAAEYYLAPGGDDEAAGTKESPWQNIEKANATLQPGDTAIFLPGEYPGSISPAAETSDSTDPITYRAAEWLQATLIGPPDEDGSAIDLQDASNIVMEGFRVTPTASTWGRAFDSDHITIRNCFMERCPSSSECLHLRRCSSVRLIDNVFKADRVTGNMVRLIACEGCVVEGNRITRVGHSPLRFDSCINMVVRANCFYNEWGRNYELVASGRVLVEDNIITEAFDSAHSADTRAKNAYMDSIFRFNRVFGNSHTPLDSPSYFPWVGSKSGFCREPFKLVNSRIYHNTITENLGIGWQLWGISIAANRLKNNCFYRNDYAGGGTQLEFREVTSKDNLVHHNLLMSTEPGAKTVKYGDTYWTTQQANDETRVQRGVWTNFANNFEAEPGYRDAENNDFRLEADGGGVNRGQALTHATSGGQGSVVPVSDIGYFYDGFGIEGEKGDWVAVGDPGTIARVERAEYRYYLPGLLHLDREIEWEANDPVSVPWAGEAPDVGAFESSVVDPDRMAALATPATPEPGQTVTFSVDPLGKEIVEAQWDFGDGTRASGAEVTHEYPEGKYGALVRATFGNGEEGVAVVFVKAQPPVDPEAAMLHCTFEDEDIEDWGWVFKFHRQRGTEAQRVEGGYQSEKCYRLFAESNGAILGARLYPGEWNIDTYPFVSFAYRIPEGTPVGLGVQLYPDEGLDQLTVLIGGTESHKSGAYEDTDEYRLTDDGQWHEITLDVRSVRHVHEDLRFIRGFRFYTAENATKGQEFWFDDFSVLPNE